MTLPYVEAELVQRFRTDPEPVVRLTRWSQGPGGLVYPVAGSAVLLRLGEAAELAHVMLAAVDVAVDQ
ncbi:hypothetical protein GCM10027047_00690 [Rhodococcus aerolatus]